MKLTFLGNSKDLEKLSIDELVDLINDELINDISKTEINLAIKKLLKNTK